MDKQYMGTRHNIGFEWADRLADELSVRFTKGNGPFWIAKTQFKGRKAGIIKPTTYMNLSGKAVQRASHYYKVPLENCLVCYDDLNLPAGTIRLRPNGSHGGHNGIKNIIQETGSRDFPRLRIGIGNNFSRGQQVKYVLSPFDKEETEDIEYALKQAVAATFCFIKNDIQIAMNQYN